MKDYHFRFFLLFLSLSFSRLDVNVLLDVAGIGLLIIEGRVADALRLEVLLDVVVQELGCKGRREVKEGSEGEREGGREGVAYHTSRGVRSAGRATCHGPGG